MIAVDYKKAWKCLHPFKSTSTIRGQRKSFESALKNKSNIKSVNSFCHGKSWQGFWGELMRHFIFSSNHSLVESSQSSAGVSFRLRRKLQRSHSVNICGVLSMCKTGVRALQASCFCPHRANSVSNENSHTTSAQD